MGSLQMSLTVTWIGRLLVQASWLVLGKHPVCVCLCVCVSKSCDGEVLLTQPLRTVRTFTFLPLILYMMT